MVEHRSERRVLPGNSAAWLRAGMLCAAMTVVAAAIGGCGFGAPYETLNRPDADGDVDVAVYFSYTCPHCRRLASLVEDWRATLPDGVALRRVHVAYPRQNRLLARSFVALERHGAVLANHQRLFDAAQDRRRSLDSPAAVADVVAGHGIDRATFLRAAESPRVASDAEAGQREFVALGLRSVPAVVVDGKYVLNMGRGREQALATAGDLARELLAKRGGG